MLLLLLFSCSVVSLRWATSWTAAHHTSLSFTISQSMLKLMSIESVVPSNHLILCHPFLLPSIFPSLRIFSNESALRISIGASASASVLPMNIQGIRNSMPPKSKESLFVRNVVEGTDGMWSDDRKPQIQPRTLELTLWGTPLEGLGKQLSIANFLKCFFHSFLISFKIWFKFHSLNLCNSDRFFFCIN